MPIETKPVLRRLHWLPVMLALGLAAVACGNGDGDGDAGSETTETSTVAAASGLTVTAVDLGSGTVTITNNGAGDVDLSGHQLCNRPNYLALPEETLASGESIDVTLGGIGADGGEVGLYTSANFGSSDDLISYVTWGSGGGRFSVAEAGGTWTGDPISEPGPVLTLTGEPGSAAGWSS